MEPPKIKGHKILAEIGEGSTGVVYEARRDDGTLCAIKVFESMSSNPTLLDDRISRVIEGGAQDITVAIHAKALDVRPACLVMPLMAERLDDSHIENYRPRTLQTYFQDYQANELTWPFLLKLAARLGTLHTIKVAHGNLKPGNIFLGANGGPLLADYASGLMPGVHRLGYSDALLYAPPEQLRYPDGYLEEAGYRWDVYAFGVLAFRLLTGSFPRCDEIFSTVSPASGTQQRFSIDADYEGIVAGLEENPDFLWPDDPADEREARHREMVNFCLCLDPMGRPGDMREVARYFGSIEGDLAADAERRQLESLRNSADRKRKRMARYLTFTALVAGGLGAGWVVTQGLRWKEANVAEGQFNEYRADAEGTIDRLEIEKDQARLSQSQAFGRQKELEEALESEQLKARNEILSARITNEALFQWILENGISGLPALEGRKARLVFLAEKIDEQLKGLEARPGLQEEMALLKLRRAEIILASGDAVKGAVALQEALAGGDLSNDETAHARLRLLLLQSKRDRAALEDGIAEAEASILKAWSDDEARRLRAEAALHLVKARMWEFKNDGAKTLESSLASVQAYRKLAEMYPESPAIALTVGRSYLSSALAAEGEGAVSDAARLRQEAVEVFTAVAKKQENPDPELEFQIASANAAKAVALWQQGKTFEADKLARKGVVTLTELSRKMPDDFRVVVDLVSQKGIIATALRDEGHPEEATTVLTVGIQLLEDGIEHDPRNWNAKYLLASLRWQMAGILGQRGKSEEEMKMGEQAHDDLKGLLASEMRNPNPSAVRKSLAYLCGDLGHSASLRDQRDTAIKYLQESKRYWQELARDEGDQIEIREGYNWAVNRLTELGVK